jgi:putative heme transporter
MAGGACGIVLVMAKKKGFLARRWKLLVNIATIVALGVLVYAIRHQLVDTFRNLSRVNAWALLAMIPIQAANYHSQTKMYQGLFGVVGNKLKYSFLYKMSLELNFVNHVFPSGGVSGISYFGMRMRDDQISGSRAALVQIMKVIMYLLSFEILLVAGLLFMALGNHVNSMVIMFTTLIATTMIIASLGFMAIIGSETRIQSAFRYLANWVNWLFRKFRPNKRRDLISVEKVENAVLDLHENYKLIQSRYRELKWTFFWSLMANLTEVLGAYAVYVAFGHWINFGAVVLAYAIANFAGLVSIMPGGIGIYEALMMAALAAAGIPTSLSLPVTVMYRVINTLIQLPPGYYFYHKNLVARKKSAKARAKEMHAEA